MHINSQFESYLEYPKGYAQLDTILTLSTQYAYINVSKYFQQLADFDLGLPDVKWYTRYAAALTQTYWGACGVEDIATVVTSNDTFAHIEISTTILAYAAAGSLEILIRSHLNFFPKLQQRLLEHEEYYKSAEFILISKKTLLNLVVNLPQEGYITHSLNHCLATMEIANQREKGLHNKAIEGLFNALNSRWFRLNRFGLNEYESLIAAIKTPEEQIHQFFASNPHILEPFFAKLWSKQPLGEQYIADFVIRLMDDSYIVVEIEKPSDMVITKNGNLSAKATHAIRQVLEYREWIISNSLYARQTFTNIWRPSGLVIIGLEASLNESQIDRLRQENESRRGVVQIVGFDWISRRSNTVLNNIVTRGFDA